MRRLVSKQKQQKSDRIKQLIVGTLLIVIMFASVLGYAFQGNEEENNSNLNYNGFEFVKQDKSWMLQNAFLFKHSPKDTEEFARNNFLNLLIDYQSKPLYIYSENKEAESEIYQNLYNSVQRIQYACLEKNESELDFNCEKDLPMKNCEDNFILISEGEFNVEQKNNCLFIQGSYENLTKISDEVLFKILGVK